MSRRLFNLAAGISLAVCFATMALWIRHGIRQGTAAGIPGTQGKYALLVSQGEVTLYRVRRSSGSADAVLVEVQHRFLPRQIALWKLILGSLVLPSAWIALRPGTVPPGHCKQCGYDLRATPERCPECGMQVV